MTDATAGYYVIGVILFAMCIGVIPGLIARSKGHEFVTWGIFGSLLFIIALPVSLFIKSDSEQLELQQVQSGNGRKCPFCAEIVKVEAKVCRYCSRDLAPGGDADDVLTRRLVEALSNRSKQ